MSFQVTGIPAMKLFPAPISVFLAICAVYVAVKFTFRIFFSPLRHIPGPKTAKLGALWYIRHMLAGDYPWAVIKAHRKYGPLVRIRHNEISVCTPEAIRQILLKTWEKASWYTVFAIPDSSWPSIMSETDTTRFSTLKKKLSAGYSLSNVLKKESECNIVIQLLERRIDEDIETGNAVSLDKWFAFFAFDMVGEATFSKGFGFLEQGVDVGNSVAISHRLMTYITFMVYFQTLHEWLTANPLVRYFELQPMRHVMATAEKAVQQREMNDDARLDMVECWKAQKLGEPLTHREFTASVNTNVAAGSDTVSSAMQIFVLQMLEHPRCLEKLQNELDSAAAVGRLSSPASWTETQDLPYFQACMKEASRVNPVSTTSYPRVVPAGGVTIEDQFLPQGTIVSVNPWPIHYDPSIWGPDADEFDPDRWLRPDARRFEHYLLQFSAGFMKCPGMPLANMQLNKLLATLFLDYDISFVEGESDWKIARAFMGRPYGWKARMKRRRNVGERNHV